jgi:hypothetical protein
VIVKSGAKVMTIEHAIGKQASRKFNSAHDSHCISAHCRAFLRLLACSIVKVSPNAKVITIEHAVCGCIIAATIALAMVKIIEQSLTT